MLEKTKVSNSKYTAEQTTDLVTEYTSAQNQLGRDTVVQSFATKFNLPEASIRSKLGHEKVYISKARTDKTGDPIISKSALVTQIAELLGEPEDIVGSLEKANKPTLKKLIARLTQ